MQNGDITLADGPVNHQEYCLGIISDGKNEVDLEVLVCLPDDYSRDDTKYRIFPIRKQLFLKFIEFRGKQKPVIKRNLLIVSGSIRRWYFHIWVCLIKLCISCLWTIKCLMSEILRLFFFYSKNLIAATSIAF